ncbi:MAG: DUF4437 domain-containing protein [Gammaproteobacteria bacterium]|nr:DUF4437 domain-containing protein [Gammaproteobacteria bacterium]
MRKVTLLTAMMLLAACASGPPNLPYPAFVQVDELEDIFMASLPGVRGKQLAGDPQTRRTSNRIDLPPAWKGTSGGMPGRSMEVFVVEGLLTIADIELPPGGYAFLPAGSLGFNMESTEGARILYFINDTDPESIIRSPIIIDAGLLEWAPGATPGIATKELRSDPGNGAKTWLLRIEAGSSVPWQSSSIRREGYLLRGNYQHSECVLGEVHTGQYMQGGYFYRPADAVNGGPLSGGETDAVWFLRETALGEETTVSGCEAAPTS